MQIKENVILAPYTTFRIGGAAKFFCEVKDQQEALQAFEFARDKKLQIFVLGGGSNLLVSDNGFEGLVIRIVNKGIEIVHQDNQWVLLKVASGEVWDEVVSFAVKNNWWGIENLSHIPGSTGAIAVQNVGAYGQEAKNVIESVTVFDRSTHEILSISGKDCGFAYRSSIFNTSARGKYIIFYLTFRLQKNGKPNLSYGDLKRYFGFPETLSVPAKPAHFPQRGENNKVLSPAEMRQAIISIRDKKFPFPTEAVKGNAGSFFKNPILDEELYSELKNRLPNLAGELEKKSFQEDGKVKIPAAFLIELCGLKDMEFGDAAINHNQPLVIINKSGKAKATDVLNLAGHVRKAVCQKTQISLDLEPELIGFTEEELKVLEVWYNK